MTQKRRLVIAIWIWLSAWSASASIISITGVEDPRLVTFSERDLGLESGIIQPRVWGHSYLAVDSDGRLFARSGDRLLEYSNSSGEIINSSPMPEGSLRELAAHNGALYSITGTDVPSLVTFDAETLALSSGVPDSSVWGNSQITFDSGGRLFARSSDLLLEFDPSSGETLNSNSTPDGSFIGLTAGNGALYSLTGTTTPKLVTIDPDTLEVTSGSLETSVWGNSDLTFSDTGRLFAVWNRQHFEFNPVTLEIINSHDPFTGTTRGIIVSDVGFAVPEPSSVLFLMMGCASVLLRRSR